MEMSLPNGVDVSQLVQHPVLAALPPFFLRASERYQKRARITEVCSSPSPPADQPSESKTPAPTPPLATPPPRSPSDHELNVEEELEDQSETSLTPENLSMKEPRPEEMTVKKEDEDKWESNQDFKYKIFRRKPESLPEPVQEETSYQKSPVDVLIKVFPRRSRQEIEAILARCKGDVVAAMDMMLNGTESNSTPYNITQESPPYLQNYQSKSAFSPLSNQSFKFSPSRRFLTPPYSGTGYLPTVIRPPPEYLSSFMPPSELMYGRQLQVPSPGTSPTSDNTNNEGFSD
ncbi:hypothetical protein ABMA27_009696 [Loxostege sticticalis]|uniref:DMA domain-containing protein n=1 Tax=Loxostege sticticalis TaxID=481309 RepID=A0ABR3H657_LOXSC